VNTAGMNVVRPRGPPTGPAAWEPFAPENLQHSTLNIEHRKVPKRFTTFVGGSTLNVRCWTLTFLMYGWSGNSEGNQLRLDWRGFWAENAFSRRDDLISQASRGELGRQ